MNIVGRLELGDVRSMFSASLEEASPVPGAEWPERRGEFVTPEFGDIDAIHFYYRSQEPTEVDLRIVFDTLWQSDFWYVAAWNDYTGWGCQDGVTFRWAPNLETLIRFGLEASDRDRWGLNA
jgi:hypothetical protein